MSDSVIDISVTLNCESDSQAGNFYIIDGKIWRIGEHKISKWSKAKCNNTTTIQNNLGSIVTNDNNTNK